MVGESRRTPDYDLRGLNPERRAAIEAYAGHEVLDVGCGNGAYVLHFADKFRIRGVDHQRFEAWKLRPELFEISDAQKLAFPDASFDTLLCFETLEHLPDPGAALREYLRVCRQNLILTVPNCELTPGMRGAGLIFNHWIDRTHVNFWTLDSISQQVVDAGFRVKARQHINRLNLKAMVKEALGGGASARLLSGIFQHAQRRDYFMTSLVVAEKAARS